MADRALNLAEHAAMTQELSLDDARRKVGMARTHKGLLLLSILGDHFGDIVKTVASVLISRGKCTLRELKGSLCVHTSERRVLRPDEVRRALLVLLQHNCLEIFVLGEDELMAMRAKRVELHYRIYAEGVLDRLRFPKFISLVRERHGPTGEAVLYDVLFHGKVRVEAVRKRVGLKLAREAMERKSGGENEDGIIEREPDTAQVIRFEHQVARMFLVLAQHRIIVPVPPLDLEHLKKTTQKNELDSQSSQRKTPSKRASSGTTNPKAKSRKVNEAERHPLQPDEPHELPLELRILMQNELQIAQRAQERGIKLDRSVPSATHASSSSISVPNGNSSSLAPTLARGKRTRGRTRGGARGRKGRGAPVVDTVLESFSVPLATAAPLDLDAPSANLLAEQATEEDPDLLTRTDESLMWMTGTDELYRWMRRQTCSTLVESKMGTVAAEVVNVMMEYSARSETSKVVDLTKPITAAEIVLRMKADSRRDVVTPLLGVLRVDSTRIIVKSSADAEWTAETSYCVHMSNMIRYLKRHAVRSMIARKHDTHSARILEMLFKLKHVDQQRLAELVILPSKEARAKLYSLYRDHLVTYSDLSKRSDFNPASTYWFWTADLASIEERLLDSMYQAALNLRIRGQHEHAQAKSIEVVVGQLSEEDRIQKRRLENRERTLIKALMTLDQTIVLFERFDG